MLAAPAVFWLYDLTPTLAPDRAGPAAAARAWDECHAVATLQGIVNRDAPRLYVRLVEHAGRNIDDWWLARLSRPGGWLAGAERRNVATLEQLVETFRDRLAGAVVYDAALPATSNVASTLAGVEDLVAIRFDETPGSVFDRLVRGGPRLPVRRSLVGPDALRLFRTAGPAAAALADRSPKCAAYEWARTELLASGRCDPRYLAYYIDAWWIRHAAAGPANHHTLSNHDYFVARRALFCDLNCWGDERPVDDSQQPPGTDLATLRSILRTAAERSGGAILHIGGFTPWAYKYTSEPGCGGRHGGVDSEWELVRIASAYGGFIDADALGHGALANASFFMHYPLAPRHAQAPRPTLAELATRGLRPGDDRDFVMFYVGDYDSAAWVYQRMPDLWEDPRRGAVPLSWAISPALARRVPMALAHLWETRSPQDAFIAADNGAGYLNPQMLVGPRPESGLPDGLAAWEAHCATLYRQWDLAITGFVITGHGPHLTAPVLDAYARFSPDGIVPYKTAPEAYLHGSLPVLQCGPDLVEEDPRAAGATAARHVAERRARGLRYHWFRTILKSPGWHADAAAELQRREPRATIVTAPEFFLLLRETLRQPR